MNRVAKIRIKSVRLKSGGAQLTVFYNDKPDLADLLREKCENVIAVQSRHADIVGFAIVVWGRDGGCVPSLEVGDGSAIPSILVPDFVRNALLADTIESWTLQGLKQP